MGVERTDLKARPVRCLSSKAGMRHSSEPGLQAGDF